MDSAIIDRPVSFESAKFTEGWTAYQKGEEFSASRNDKQAVACYDQAIACGFEDAEVYSSRGICLQFLGFDLDAIDDFNKAIWLSPEDCNLVSMRAISRRKTGDLDGAIADMEKAIELSRLDTKLNRHYKSWAAKEGREGGITRMYEISLADYKRELRGESRITYLKWVDLLRKDRRKK